ncbi:hypothetical protein GCM10009665_01310 [Kitasatospora nipponensis]|uniref:Uncharacterized protein n=1 Tax=Kitasatospora nipponensis TaxID=258049 RepID=A0ABP4G6Q4_9ACTN
MFCVSVGLPPSLMDLGVTAEYDWIALFAVTTTANHWDEPGRASGSRRICGSLVAEHLSWSIGRPKGAWLSLTLSGS